MKNTLKFFYYTVAAFIVLYLVGTYILKPDYTQYYDLGAEIEEIIPDEVVVVNESTKDYCFTITKESTTSRSIRFDSSHEMVEVYADEELTFERKTTNRFFGHTPGAAINVINLPVGVKTVRIRLEEVYPDEQPFTHVFYYGNGMLMFDQLISESIWALMTSALIIAIGFLMYLFWLATRKRFLINESLKFFAWFAMLIGLWALLDTNYAIVMFKNRVLCSIISYFVIYLMVYPFLQFVRLYMNMEKDSLFKFVCVTSIVTPYVILLLQVFQIMSLRESSKAMHVLIVLGLSYTVWISIHQYRRGLVVRKMGVFGFGAIFLLASIVYNVYLFYHGTSVGNNRGKFGILFFVFLIGMENVIEAYERINDGKQAVMYRQMAFTDVMTGLFNRSAFERWEESTSDFRGFGIVTFDLNDLKKCNDTMGHAMGDKYITSVATLISDTFGHSGKCYRIGGDEFCVIIKDQSDGIIKELIDRYREKEHSYNAKSKDLQVGTSIGYAIYARNDASFEKTRDRADMMLYKNKQEIKARMNKS